MFFRNVVSQTIQRPVFEIGIESFTELIGFNIQEMSDNNFRATTTMTTTVKTLNIGTPRPATVGVLNIKQFNFTMK